MRPVKLLVSVMLCLAVSCAVSGAQTGAGAGSDGTWQSFRVGIALLEKGAPRAEVLAQWEATLKDYPNSEYQHQLLSYVTVLRHQVNQDKVLASTKVQNPEKLPLDQRISYYISRFPDVQGVQLSQPGHCSVLGQGERTKFSDAIVRIGRPAVPSLIEHLRDRRLTRSIGFWRNFDPHRTVLRGQDVAMQCIEAILKLPYLPVEQTYLSTAPYSLQMRIIGQMRAWWQQNGQVSPLQGYINRLRDLSARKAPVWQRVEVLTSIERIDPKAVPSVRLLKQWAQEIKRSNRDYYATLARELMRRGDLSLLPDMQQRIRLGRTGEGYVPEECIWCILKAGDANDFQVLRRRVREEMRLNRQGSIMGYRSAILSVTQRGLWPDRKPVRNPLVVLILVDLLSDRREFGQRGSAPATFGYSNADMAMGVLVAMIRHDAGYEPLKPAAERFVAIDRWLAWWNRQGKTQYLKK